MPDTSLMLESSHKQHISSPKYAPDIFCWTSCNATEQQVPERQAWQNYETKIEFIDDWVYSADEKMWAWISRVISAESCSVILGRPNRSPSLLILALFPSFTCIQSSLLVLSWTGFLWATENMIYLFSIHSFFTKAPQTDSPPQEIHCSWSQPSC